MLGLGRVKVNDEVECVQGQFRLQGPPCPRLVSKDSVPTNHLYASIIEFFMIKYNLNGSRDYGTNLELLECENIHIKTLFEK